MSHSILHGHNSVDLDDRVRSLALSFDPSGIGTVRIDASTLSLADIQLELGSPPFFSGQRVVIVEGLFGASRTADADASQGQGTGWNELEPLLPEIPATTSMIIVHRGNIPANRRALKHAARENWTVERFDVPRSTDLIRWVMERARREDVEMGQQAARRLLELLYPTSWQRENRWDSQVIDMQLLATEITKLACGAIQSKVTPSIVDELVIDRSGITAFKLNDEVYEGRASAALIEVDHVLEAGDVPERILAQLAHQAVALQATSVVPKYDAKAVSAASDVSAGQLGLTLNQKTGWRQPRAMQQASEELRRAEWLVKTGRTRRTESTIVPLVGSISEKFRIDRANRSDPRR